MAENAEREPDSVRALREALADSDIANAYGVAHPGRVIRAARALLDALPGLLAEAWDEGAKHLRSDRLAKYGMEANPYRVVADERPGGGSG
jgi:hypothetical protein